MEKYRKILEVVLKCTSYSGVNIVKSQVFNARQFNIRQVTKKLAGIGVIVSFSYCDYIG